MAVPPNLLEMKMSKRIGRLRKKILDNSRYVSMEQAKLVSEYYQQGKAEPRIIQRAAALKYVAERIPVSIDPEELIIGNRSPGIRDGIVFPEASVAWIDKELDTMAEREQDPFHVREEDARQFREEVLPFWKGRTLEDRVKAELGEGLEDFQRVVKINQKDHAQGHIIPDVRTWLKKGPEGLIHEARSHLDNEKDSDKINFYRATLLALEAFQLYVKRYEDLALEMSSAEKDPELAAHLEKLAGLCSVSRISVPGSFYEALQSVWFLFAFLHLESNASSFSPGRLDQLFLPYYQKDIQAGSLVGEDALELIEAFFIKCNQVVYLRNSHSARFFAGFPIGFNICIGGKDSSGRDQVNELSHLFLKAQEHLGLPQPNLSARIHSDSGEEYLDHCSRVIGEGSGMPQLFNDESIIPALLQQGISSSDAFDYGVVGCVELSTQGNFLGWSDAAMVNLVKIFELTLNNGQCMQTGKKLGPDLGNLRDYSTFEALESAFGVMLDHFIERTIETCNKVDRIHREVLPSPFLSTVIDNCMEKGLDVTAGGAYYNLSGVQCIQVANIADSLYALKEAVYDSKKYSRDQMLDALKTNFLGKAEMRYFLREDLLKYGNDNDEVDGLGLKWAKRFADRMGVCENIRGGKYHTGFYTVSAHIPMGANVGATPDGRLSGTPLADGGMSPMSGMDKKGPTAVLNSVSKIDSMLGSNGTLLNMKFLPAIFREDKDRKAFVNLLRGFTSLKISHVQFNVVNSSDLQRAREHPDEYRNLTVRVAGYTAYFVDLAEDLQDEIIARTVFGE